MAELLSIGPPVYFVVTSGLDYSENIAQNLICGGPLCNNDSISVKLYMASQFPEMYEFLVTQGRFLSYSEIFFSIFQYPLGSTLFIVD